MQNVINHVTFHPFETYLHLNPYRNLITTRELTYEQCYAKNSFPDSTFHAQQNCYKKG